MLRTLLCWFLPATLLAANKPIATVTAAQSISVNGVDISTRGVPTWPLVSGDQVKTGSQQAMITLIDGSHFLMGPNSALKIANCAIVEIELREGTVEYQISSASSAQMCLRGTRVEPKPLASGTASIQADGKPVVQTPAPQTVTVEAGKCACQRSPITTPVLLIAGAAAVALGLGLGLTLPSSASPSTP
jgi:hypothetical protein